MSEISFDNFEGFGGDYSRLPRDSTDLANEIEELKYSNRKLQEENNRLSSQIAHADDVYQTIIQENRILNKKVESVQLLVIRIKEMEREYDDMKEALSSLKTENYHLKTDISESEKERILYQGRAETLEKKLQLMEEDTAYFKLEEKKLLSIIESQEKSLLKAESCKTQIQEDLILKEEKCKEMENVMNQYREVLENVRNEKMALECNVVNEQEDTLSNIQYQDLNDLNDAESVTEEYELPDSWQSKIGLEKTNEWSHRNLKDEIQEIEKEAESSYLNRLLNLQNIFKTTYAELKEHVSVLSRVNSQAASVLELNNAKESNEKEDPPVLQEREHGKDSFDESIQEQINAELKALRAQIARSQAVLAFLQTKGSSLPQGIEKQSIKWPPQQLDISEQVDVPGNLDLYMGYLRREQTLPEQSERPRFARHRNPPNRFPVESKINSNSSRSLSTMHSVPPYSKGVEASKCKTDGREEKRTNDIPASANDNKENNKLDSENKSKDEPKNSSEKDIKMHKHTKRRLSGSGQSNSSPGIVRCPAFDFSEQDDDLTSTAALQIAPNIKRRDTTNKCKVPMPDLKENSETESAKGSANGSFEYEAGEALLSANQIEITTGNDPAFPSLPDSFLKRLGVYRSTPISIEALSDEEIEAKFNALSLAFKTDKYTLAKRIELHQRQRDITEKNIENELTALKELIMDLSQHYSEGESKELICKIQNHVDIIEQSTSRISSRAEIFGSVQQEERLNQAVEIMVNHVENVKRLYKKEHQELEEMRNLLNESKAFDDNSGDSAGEEGKRSLRSLVIASTATKQETMNSISSTHSMIAKHSSCWSRSSESFSCTDTYNLPAFGHFSFTSVSRKWSALGCPTTGATCPPVVHIATASSTLKAFVGSSENNSGIKSLPDGCENRKAVCTYPEEQVYPKVNVEYTNGTQMLDDNFCKTMNNRIFSEKLSECKVHRLCRTRYIPFRFPATSFLVCLSVITLIVWILVSFMPTNNDFCFKDNVIKWSWTNIFKKIIDHVIVTTNILPPI